jgi:DNA polymerase-4
MSNQKVIMLLDMDAFFASCLQAKYPEYKNKPIVISEGKKRSIICAASYEARKFGARSAMPFAQAQTLAKGKLIPVHADMILFKEISNSI